MPERRPLLGGPIHSPLHRIDIHKRHCLRPGQQGCPRRQPGQHPPMHRRQHFPCYDTLSVTIRSVDPGSGSGASGQW